jgi:hypothetical protein
MPRCIAYRNMYRRLDFGLTINVNLKSPGRDLGCFWQSRGKRGYVKMVELMVVLMTRPDHSGS